MKVSQLSAVVSTKLPIRNEMISRSKKEEYSPFILRSIRTEGEMDNYLKNNHV